MKAYQLYREVEPALIKEMLDYFRDYERPAYRQTLANLAKDRKLRPVFVERKPVAEQYAWLHKTLKLRTSDVLGEHLFQVWFMKAKQQMLSKFCDILGIEHDGHGQVTGDLPEEIAAEPLNEAVEALLEDYDPKLVTLYLRVFNIQRPEGWECLTRKLEEDERLSLS